MLAKGSNSVGWGKLGITAAGWVAAPMVGAVVSTLVFIAIHMIVYRADEPQVQSKRLQPVFLWLCFFVNVLFMLFKGPKVGGPLCCVKNRDEQIAFCAVSV